jgi:amidase
MPGYSVWVNLLDYSAAVLPVTTVDKTVDVVDEGYKPISGADEKVWKGCELSSLAHESDEVADGRKQMIPICTMVRMLVCRLWDGGFRKKRSWL